MRIMRECTLSPKQTMMLGRCKAVNVYSFVSAFGVVGHGRRLNSSKARNRAAL